MRCAHCSHTTVIASTSMRSASCSPSTMTILPSLAARVNRAAFEAGIVLVELNPLRTTLEDRYLAMAKGGSR